MRTLDHRHRHFWLYGLTFFAIGFFTFASLGGWQ